MASSIDRYSCNVCCRRELPEPTIEAQQIERTLCAISGVGVAVGTPGCIFTPTAGATLDPEEGTVLYESVDISTSFSRTDDDGGDILVDDDESYSVNVSMAYAISEWDPEDCGTVVVDGSYSDTEQSFFEADPAQVEDDFSASGTWSSVSGTSASPATATGSSTLTTYNIDGDVIDTDSGPESRTWFSPNPSITNDGNTTVSTSLVGGLLVHEVDWSETSGITSEEESQLYEFADAYTAASASTALLTDAVDTDSAKDGAWATGDPEASMVPTYIDEPNEDFRLSAATATIMRYRWEIPASWPGSYFKIEWDEVFFPADGTTPTATPKSWTWTGGSKTGAWSSEVKVSAGSVGTVEIRNVRFIGWSTTDSIPQYHADFETYDP